MPNSESDPALVLHLITDLGAGGAQSTLFRYLECRDSTAFRHRIACLYGGDKVTATRIRDLGVEVIDLRMSRAWPAGGIRRLVRLLRHQPVAVLHAWLFHPSLLARLVGRLLAVPMVITSRRSPRIGPAWREWAMRMTRRLDDAVIAVDQAAREALLRRKGALADRVHVIGNGVRLPDLQTATAKARCLAEIGATPESPLVVCVGRLRPEKGQADLLAAWQKISHDCPSAELVLIGEGPTRRSLVSMIRDRGLKRVHLLGLRDDVQAWLGVSRVLVLPSHWEGQSQALLEAMAAGVPIVATATPGTREWVEHERTGLLVPPGSTELLAQAVVRLLVDPQLGRRLAKTARERVVRDFSATAMAQAMERLYRRLLKTRPAGAPRVPSA